MYLLIFTFYLPRLTYLLPIFNSFDQMNIYLCYVGVVQINIGMIAPPPFLVISPNHYIVTHFKFTLTLNINKRLTNHMFWLLALQSCLQSITYQKVFWNLFQTPTFLTFQTFSFALSPAWFCWVWT
jgi:hypothetical protein